MSDTDETLDLEEVSTGDRPLTLPDEIPILPLRDTVLYPNSFMPLAVARESSETPEPCGRRRFRTPQAAESVRFTPPHHISDDVVIGLDVSWHDWVFGEDVLKAGRAIPQANLGNSAGDSPQQGDYLNQTAG